MTFNAVRVGGWPFGEILTSGQMNQINDDLPFAIDGRDGGSYTLSAGLEIETAAATDIVLNDVTIAAPSSGSHVVTLGGVIGRKTVSKAGPGFTSAGTHLVGYQTSHLWAASTTVSAGCIWQIQTNPPTGDTSYQWVMRFVNFDSTVITVRDPAATVLGTLVFTTGNQFAMTVAWDGSAWEKIDTSFHP